MGCSKCKSTSSCSCSSASPYYLQAAVCEENLSTCIVQPKFSFAVCPCVSWNVPACGQTSLLSVEGLMGAAIGSYIWNTAYGYFKITSVDNVKGLLGVTNECLPGNATPGVQIPKGTCFIITDTPAESVLSSQLYPYVAIDFTAQADSICIPITVTTINGLSVGDTISIGTGFYSIQSISSDTTIVICNDGEGIAVNTSVIAQDQFGNYQYPIYVTSSCCTALSTDVDALEVAVDDLESTIAFNQTIVNDTPQTAGTTVYTPVITYIFSNTSLTRTRNIVVQLQGYFCINAVGGGAVARNIFTGIELSENGGAYAAITPDPFPVLLDGDGFRTTHCMSAALVRTLAPGGSLTVAFRASADCSTNTTYIVYARLNAQALSVRVN